MMIRQWYAATSMIPRQPQRRRHVWIMAAASVFSSSSSSVDAPTCCSHNLLLGARNRLGNGKPVLLPCYNPTTSTTIRALSSTRGGGAGGGLIDGDAVGLIQVALAVSNKRKQQLYLENFVRIYMASNEEDRQTVLDHLALTCGRLDHQAVLAAALHYQNNLKLDSTTLMPHPSAAANQAALQMLQTCTPTYQYLLQRIQILTDDPTKFFIQARIDLQKYMRRLRASSQDTTDQIFHLKRLCDHLVHQVLPL